MSAKNDYPHTIPMGNGPSIEVFSEAEHEAFLAAARANTETVKAAWLKQAADEGRLVVALMNSEIERPDAPLGVSGPFPDVESAQEFADHWTARLTADHVSVQVGVIPSPDGFASWLVNSRFFDVADDAPSAPKTGG